MALHNGNFLKSSSKIVKLDPLLEHNGTLKVGEDTENVKYQMIFSIQFYCQSPVKLLHQ